MLVIPGHVCHMSPLFKARLFYNFEGISAMLSVLAAEVQRLQMTMQKLRATRGSPIWRANRARIQEIRRPFLLIGDDICFQDMTLNQSWGKRSRKNAPKRFWRLSSGKEKGRRLGRKINFMHKTVQVFFDFNLGQDFGLEIVQKCPLAFFLATSTFVGCFRAISDIKGRFFGTVEYHSSSYSGFPQKLLLQNKKRWKVFKDQHWT